MKTLSFSDKLLSIKDVSEILNLSEITVKRYIYDGKLMSFKIGNARRVKVDDVKDFISNSEIQKKFVTNTDLKIIPGYMGIKTQILDHIHLEINKIANKGDVILDIFTGSGSVGYELKRDFTVYSNDIEPYAYIVSKLLIDNTMSRTEIEDFDFKSFEEHYEENLEVLLKGPPTDLQGYYKNHEKFPYTLFTNYFSGTYFGKTQAMQIDSLRYAIDKTKEKYKTLLLSCLIFSCYQTVTSVGSHFAQPKIAKAKNKTDIEKKRQQDVKKYFLKKFSEIKENLYIDKKKNRAFCDDFKDLLTSKEIPIGKISVTYIDPPYTIDHYSRFYHILNTLVLYDYPGKVGKGLYRTDRYQSKFCIKSTVLEEFEALVGNLSRLKSKIVMSYSDGYRSLLTTDEILGVLGKHYKMHSIKSPIKIEYSYSGFGRSASNKANELLFVATEPK